MSGHAHRNVRSNSMLGMMPGLDKDFQQRVDDYSARERDSMRRGLLALSDDQLLQLQFIPPDVPRSQTRRWLEDNVDRVVNLLQQVQSGQIETPEAQLYGIAKAFMPPKELASRHPSLREAWDVLSKGSKVTPALQRKVCDSGVTS